MLMGLSLLNDANGVSTTFLEEDAKHPPFDIQEEGKGPIPTKAPLPDTESTSRRVRLPSGEAVQMNKKGVLSIRLIDGHIRIKWRPFTYF